MFHVSYNNHMDDSKSQSEDDSNSESDDEDGGTPRLVDDQDNDSDSYSDDDELDDNNIAGVTKRVRFEDDNNISGVTNDEEAMEKVEHSKCKFTKRDQLKAKTVRRFQHVAGCPPDDKNMHSVNANDIKNSPITRRDFLLVKEMLGPSKCAIQGKTTRSKPDFVDVTLHKIDAPKSTMKFYKDVELSADVMHGNDVLFLTTMSENMHYGKISALDNLKCQSLEFELKNVIRHYAIR